MKKNACINLDGKKSCWRGGQLLRPDQRTERGGNSTIRGALIGSGAAIWNKGNKGWGGYVKRPAHKIICRGGKGKGRPSYGLKPELTLKGHANCEDRARKRGLLRVMVKAKNADTGGRSREKKGKYGAACLEACTLGDSGNLLKKNGGLKKAKQYSSAGVQTKSEKGSCSRPIAYELVQGEQRWV